MADSATPVLPTPDAPAYASVVQLAQWIREKKTSPIRLANYYLDRLAKFGPSLNAVVNLTRDLAKRQAEQAERELQEGRDRGPLHGIPYGVKDLFAVPGYPTTWGAAPYRERVLNKEAAVVGRLREAGAILCAKLAMVECAGGMGYRQPNASFTGPGLNPWNKTTWSGGSSSGSGSAVGAGLVPFAIGTETWGSIMTPAAYCGVTGLRPTFGRISRAGAMALSWSLDKVGPMTRSAEDASLVLQALVGQDPDDPATLPANAIGLAPAQPKYNLAILKDVERLVDADTFSAYRRSLDSLANRVVLTEIDRPKFPFNQATDLILSAEVPCALEELVGKSSAETLTAVEDHLGGLAGALIPARDYIRALRIRGRAMKVLADWLGPFDALVTPTMGSVAPPVDGSFRDTFAKFPGPDIGGASNLVGLPAVCFPNGLSPTGLPLSLCLTGKMLSEPILLRIAKELQDASPWHRLAPSGFPA